MQRLAELALFSILFTDGMRLNLRELTSKWQLPGRALIIEGACPFGMSANIPHAAKLERMPLDSGHAVQLGFTFHTDRYLE